MLALKPSLFPLPPLCCLLFLQSAFHSGFNSLQTLPNGFFTWGPQHAWASHQFPEISRAPPTQKGDPFPTLPPLSPGCSSAQLCTPDTKLGGQRGKAPLCGPDGGGCVRSDTAENPTCPESRIHPAVQRRGRRLLPAPQLALPGHLVARQGERRPGTPLPARLSPGWRRAAAPRPRRGAPAAGGGLHRHPAAVSGECPPRSRQPVPLLSGSLTPPLSPCPPPRGLATSPLRVPGAARFSRLRGSAVGGRGGRKLMWVGRG